MRLPPGKLRNVVAVLNQADDVDVSEGRVSYFRYTWFAWKRIHNIVYAGRQLELFRDNSADLWATLRDPAAIEPFPYFETPSPSKSSGK